eukprot:TRINITY_DN26257_c0_g1_i1.p1 TRINITY_DN26257_c0_g1~~TRINITY_DN26257_c0_g1_i1.p1  ORF type:complete len:102 (-),score=6.98 TRINITY_DN26257_c0_g1_i1:2-286(-)
MSTSSRDRLMCLNQGTKPCKGQVIDGYKYCIRHILQDPSSPYTPCLYLNPSNNAACANAVHKLEPGPKYCINHKGKIGLTTRKYPKKTGMPHHQ